MHHPSVLATVAAALAAVPAAHGFYTKSSPVLQVDARSYDKLISKSNHTSLVEFYAPWCGHCKNLQPAYEKTATQLDGLAKVAAVDCDADANKGLCASVGVTGFPTLKIVRPSSKPGGNPVVEDYKGARTAAAMAQAVSDKINNHVTRVSDKDADDFLAASAKPKLLLFTDKGTTSALLRSIAIDFLDVIEVGQVRNKNDETWNKFGVTESPTLVLIPGAGEEPVIYKGEVKNRKHVVEFLKQVAEPNPDPAPAKGGKRSKSSSKPKKSSSTEAAEEKATPEPEESPDPSTAEPTAESAAPTIVPIAPITSQLELAEKCLQPKSHTCVLAFVPGGASPESEQAIASLSQLSTKYIQAQRPLFPVLPVPGDVDGTSALKKALDLSADVEIVAINARRGWLRQYSGDFSVASVETWFDVIRMGEGEKKKLPKEIISEVVETSTESTESSSEETKGTSPPEPEAETEAPEAEEKIVHGEL